MSNTSMTSCAVIVGCIDQPHDANTSPEQPRQTASLHQSRHTSKQLLANIDQLRGRFPHTQDLYREVCVLLFFRYGITPTTNKLYQLVRKGSMSAPAEALNKFWEDLRDKSRVRIEHRDLP